MGEIQKFQEQMAGHHQALGEAQAKLTALVRKEPTDETNTLAQLDEVMKQEREIKRAQWIMLVHLKNKLTPDQRERLRVIKGRLPAGEANIPPERREQFELKVQQVQTAAQQWVNQGRDPQPVIDMMREVQDLLQKGKPQKAEEMLENALKLMEASPGKPPR